MDTSAGLADRVTTAPVQFLLRSLFATFFPVVCRIASLEERSCEAGLGCLSSLLSSRIGLCRAMPDPLVCELFLFLVTDLCVSLFSLSLH